MNDRSEDSAAAANASPTLADVQAAAARIAPHAHRTPVMRSSAVDEIVGASLHFKCENLQKVGAFKFRGACNTLLSLNLRWPSSPNGGYLIWRT